MASRFATPPQHGAFPASWRGVARLISCKGPQGDALLATPPTTQSFVRPSPLLHSPHLFPTTLCNTYLNPFSSFPALKFISFKKQYKKQSGAAGTDSVTPAPPAPLKKHRRAPWRTRGCKAFYVYHTYTNQPQPDKAPSLRALMTESGKSLTRSETTPGQAAQSHQDNFLSIS
jgi:hypothetical protein